MNSTKHLRSNAKTSKTFPKSWRGGKTPKLALWCQHCPYVKVRQGHYKERKLQANMPDEHRYKYSQQNTSKLNPTVHLNNYTPRWSGMKFNPGMWGWFNIHHISRIKYLNPMIIRVEVEKNNPTLGIYPVEIKSLSKRDIYTLMFIAALFTIAMTWKEPKFSLMN